MAFITYPLNNIDYTAEDAELFHCTRTSGIWAEDSFPISVTGADNNVTIGTGIAWINNEEFSGKVAALKSAEVLDLGIADSTYPRIDVIAIQYSANNNATDVVIKKGTPATNPVRPAIVRSGAVYELYLASIYRPAGAIAITASNITDLRMDETVCGLMADSVTKVDMTAIEAQVRAFINNLQNEIDEVKNLSGLMFETEWTEGGVIPVSKGGTEAVTAEEARQNINFIGTNPIASVAEDTVANWLALGTGIASYGTAGLLIDQPQQYGAVFNMVSGNSVRQMWFNLAGGNVYHRGGNQNGWSHTWRKVLDENNGIQMKKIWQNASPTSAFAAQTVNLTLSSSDIILVFLKCYNSVEQYIVAICKVGKNIRFSYLWDASYEYLRNITPSTSGVAFGACSYGKLLQSMSTENTGLIPVEISVIKGVQ